MVKADAFLSTPGVKPSKEGALLVDEMATGGEEMEAEEVLQSVDELEAGTAGEIVVILWTAQGVVREDDMKGDAALWDGFCGKERGAGRLLKRALQE